VRCDANLPTDFLDYVAEHVLCCLFRLFDVLLVTLLFYKAQIGLCLHFSFSVGGYVIS